MLPHTFVEQTVESNKKKYGRKKNWQPPHILTCESTETMDFA